MKHTLTFERQVEITKIALTGKFRSGKDSVGHHLYIKYGFDRVAFGDELKRQAHTAFPWISELNKPRSLYQQYGQLMRQIDPDIWIKHAERAIKGTIDFRVNCGKERIGIVLTDVRQLNEIDWCRRNGFTIVRVTAPDEHRLARATAEGDTFTKAELAHETEQHVDKFIVDFEIVNDGSVSDLKEKMDEVMVMLERG
jgi:dephospho-CoA kinase